MSPKAAEALLITGNIFEIGVVSILSYSMWGVNGQLALFFEQVGRKGYRKNSIAFFIVAYFLLEINWLVMVIFGYFIEVDKMYYTVTGWARGIFFFLLYLFVTLAFFFLADFGLEARTSRVGPETTNRSLNFNINSSTAN